MNSPNSSHFATTHWTRIRAARGASAEAGQALSELCAAYYSPVVAFLRRDGRDDDAARELAHQFFAELLQRQSSLAGADPSHGRFRSYLLGALKHFAANQRAKAARHKRGGHVFHIPLEEQIPGQSEADAQFDREWALSILNRTIDRMKDEAAAAGREREFDLLKPCLTGELQHRDAAAELGLSDGALRVAIHRLRRRFRELVRAEIAQTLSHPNDLPGEMQHLIAALA